jgi:hypothetical protein
VQPTDLLLWIVDNADDRVVFSPLPLSFSPFALMPYLGAGPLDLELGVGLLPIAGETFRNLLFGAALGDTYALFCAARQTPPTVTTPVCTLEPADGTV